MSERDTLMVAICNANLSCKPREADTNLDPKSFLRMKPTINHTRMGTEEKKNCWLRNLTVKTTHDKWWFPDLFIFIEAKVAVSFLISCPIWRICICSLAYYLGSGIESCENKETSNVQPLISDLNAYNISFD